MSNVVESGGKYQGYPEYKDSGIEWLKNIPSHWFSTKVKYGYDITLGKMLQRNSQSSEDKLKPYLKAVNIQPDGISLDEVGKMWFSPKELQSLRLLYGDILISEGGDVGRSAIWRNDMPECYIQNAINRARPKKKQSSGFLFYWMSMLKNSEYIDILCNKATIAHYTVEKVENSPLFIPPDIESKKITNFLDHETAKIDTLIEKQQQLIKLLKEKRQAVISHAVTKGLNPDAPMKDSGVEWLGEVPEHWEIAKVKYFASIQGGYAFSSDSFQDSGIQILRIGNVYLNRLALERQPAFVDDSFVKTHKSFSVWRDDILMSLTGTLGKTDYGFAVRVDEDGPFMLNQRVAKISPIPAKIIPNYLIYAIRSDSYLKQLYSLPSGTKQANLSNDDVVNIPIAVPPSYDEQMLVAQHISDGLVKYDNLIKKSESAIKIMQERRTALISAAVTGKIDVRNWKAAA